MKGCSRSSTGCGRGGSGGAGAAAAVALFGTQAEDMAGALASLDLSTAAQQLGGIEGAAGAADRALATMSDNTSTKIESAKRNIEAAMDGINGALAEAFGDEISGSRIGWRVTVPPLMQFFLDVINGAIDAGKGLPTSPLRRWSRSGNFSLAWRSLPLINQDMRDAFTAASDGANSAAATIRTKIPAALDETKGKINDWAGPESR